MVFFKFNCELDIWMSGVEILQKLSSGGYIVEQQLALFDLKKTLLQNRFPVIIFQLKVVCTSKYDDVQEKFHFLRKYKL